MSGVTRVFGDLAVASRFDGSAKVVSYPLLPFRSDSSIAPEVFGSLRWNFETRLGSVLKSKSSKTTRKIVEVKTMGRQRSRSFENPVPVSSRSPMRNRLTSISAAIPRNMD